MYNARSDTLPLIGLFLGAVAALLSVVVAGATLLGLVQPAAWSTALYAAGPILAIVSYEGLRWTRGLNWAHQLMGTTPHYWLRTLAVGLAASAAVLLLTAPLSLVAGAQVRVALGLGGGALLSFVLLLVVPVRPRPNPREGA